MHCEMKDNRQFASRTSAHRSFRASLGLSTVLFLASVSFAQVDRSGLSGIVTDSSGRLLGQTHVTAVHHSTQLRREAVSHPNGSYDIPALPVGVYTITFDHPGFKALTFVDVEQVIGRTRTLDAALRVAGSQERVEVSASLEPMDTSNDALGDASRKRRQRSCRSTDATGRR